MLVGPEEGPSWAEKITRWLDSIDAFSYVDDQPPCVAASCVFSCLVGPGLAHLRVVVLPTLLAATCKLHTRSS